MTVKHGAPLEFLVLGRALRVSRAPESMRAFLADHWFRPWHAGSPSPFRLGVRWCEGVQPGLAHAAAPRVGAGGSHDAFEVRVSTRADRTDVIIASPYERVGLHLRPSRAAVLAWGAFAPGSAGRESLLTAVHEALRSSGLLPLHCAAALAPGEVGATLFLGAGGTGKSTTLMRVANAGWSPVCEDLAWFDPASGTLYGWDLGLRLLPDALRELAPIVADSQGDDPKRFVSFRELERRLGVRHRPSAPLSRVVLLRRGAQRASEWRPLSRLDAAQALWLAAGLPLSEAVRDRTSRQIARIVEQAELATLYLGEGPLPLAEAPPATS